MNEDKLATLYTAHVTVLKLVHDRALDQCGFDHLVVFAGAQKYQFLDDMAYPFKVNPHFKWWVPVLDNPHCFLVYTPGLKPRLVYHQPVDYWHTPPSPPSGFWTHKFDIVSVPNPQEAKQYMPKGRVALVGDWDPDLGDEWGFAEHNPKALLDRVHYDRAWKTEYEIECVRGANERGARGHIAAEKAFREGLSEYETHLDYLRAADHVDDELPYGNIIAFNEHAAVLHYYQHERKRLDKKERHSFLIDAGGTYNGYASDITRTYSAKKDEFQELIDAMDAAQQEICAAVAPKVNYPDLHILAHRKVAELLVRFKFVKDIDADGAFDKKITSTFLPHGVGHYLGLQVHDVGGFSGDHKGTLIPKPEGHPYLRLTRVIDRTQIFTIEPGFYFIDPLLAELQKSDNAQYVNWKKVDEFRKYGGIRIEDDVVVTDNGHENLTRQAFVDVA